MTSTEREKLRHLSCQLREKAGEDWIPSQVASLYYQYYDKSSQDIDISSLLTDIKNGTIVREEPGKDPALRPDTPKRPSSSSSSSASRLHSATTASRAAAMGLSPAQLNTTATSTSSMRRTSGSPRTIEQLLSYMYTVLCRCLGEDITSTESAAKRAILYLSESYGAHLNRGQLRAVLSTRLRMTLSDAEIETIIKSVDKNCSGVVNLRFLINAMVRQEGRSIGFPTANLYNTNSLSTEMGDMNLSRDESPFSRPIAILNSQSTTQITRPTTATIRPTNSTPTLKVRPSSADMSLRSRTLHMKALDHSSTLNSTLSSTDEKFNPIPPFSCRSFTTEELEQEIWFRVVGNRQLPLNASTEEQLLNEFTTRSTDGTPCRKRRGQYVMNSEAFISLLWYRLSIPVLLSDAIKLVHRYRFSEPPKPITNDSIPINPIIEERFLSVKNFVTGLVDRQRTLEKYRQENFASTLRLATLPINPIIEPQIRPFLVSLRRHMDKLFHREQCAPIHLLVDREGREGQMTEIRTREFLKHRLHFSIDVFPMATQRAIRHVYGEGGRLDVRQMFLHALSLRLTPSEREEPGSVTDFAAEQPHFHPLSTACLNGTVASYPENNGTVHMDTMEQTFAGTARSAIAGLRSHSQSADSPSRSGNRVTIEESPSEIVLETSRSATPPRSASKIVATPPQQSRPTTAPSHRPLSVRTLTLFTAEETETHPVSDTVFLSSAPATASPKSKKRSGKSSKSKKSTLNLDPFSIDVTKAAVISSFKISQTLITTTHEEYGLFTRNLSRAAKKRRALHLRVSKRLANKAKSKTLDSR